MARLHTQAKGKMKVTDALEEAASEGARRVDFTSARNKLLFNFGILLLEIGFGQPWHVLKKSVVVMATGEQLSNYRTAEKLVENLASLWLPSRGPGGRGSGSRNMGPASTESSGGRISGIPELVL